MRKILTFAMVIFFGLQLRPPKLPSSSITSPLGNVNIAISTPVTANIAADTFRFISWGDAQDESANLTTTAIQANSLNPAFTIFNGDLESDGVVNGEMNPMTVALGNLYAKTFLVRGNHDDHVSGSAGLWQTYFTVANRPLPAGVSNYIGLNSSSTYLTYSFDYGNSRFIGIDAPGDADTMSAAALTFLDNRLTDAENVGLTHAFIYFHGPEYCVESTHCDCTAKNDGSCTPGAFITVINKHPVVSATFHGHEHILGWVHMDNTRVSNLTHPYEEFITSPSGGGSYNEYMFPARMVYYYPDMGSYDNQGFAAIDVNGTSFTFSIYKVGTTAPVWSKTFTKPGTVITATPTPTRTPTPTPVFTGTKHFTANETNEDSSKAYTNAAAIGFNIHDTGMSTSTINALPDGSQAMIWVGIGASNCSTTLSSTFTSFVLANATNPRLYGFYLTDEPINDTCVTAVTAYTKYIHDNAPGKKAFILLTDWPGTYAAYRPAVTNVDLIGLDPYPVKGGTYDNTLISHKINDAIAAGIPLANIVPVFQTFGGAGWDAPTATQLTTILGQWATLIPNPPLDYAYSWGTQSNSLSDALVNRADWRDIMAVHNNAQIPVIFELFLPLILL